MKRFLFLLVTVLTIGIATVSAQEIIPDPETAGIVLDFTTFAGIAAVVSLAGTQLIKLLPSIGNSALWKIITSVMLGIGITCLSWALGWAEFLGGIPWWQAGGYGIIIGLSSSGLFDFLKGLFLKKS